MLTADERRALQLARDIIRNGRQEFICVALTQVMVNNPRLIRAGHRLRCYIDGALEGEGSLGWWQRCHGFDRDRNQQRLDRMAWIDWMLGDGSC